MPQSPLFEQFQHVFAGDVSRWQDVGPLWVEHIMPLSPTQRSWTAVIDSDGNQTVESKFKVDTLGNLTLLSRNRNIRASDRSVDIKRATYSG